VPSVGFEEGMAGLHDMASRQICTADELLIYMPRRYATYLMVPMAFIPFIDLLI